MSNSLQIIILGMMGRCPFGGQIWLYLNWLRGFQQLGHEVWYVEDDPSWPYDPEQNIVTDDCRYAVRQIAADMKRIELADHWAFRLAGKPGACWGMASSELDELYHCCDVLLNIVGATDLREEQMMAPLRIYVQTDPVIAELRLANGDDHTRKAFAGHHLIFTYGENYGASDCGVPLNDITYLKTRQPVDLKLWPMVYDQSAPYFTTIGNYRQSGSDIPYHGQVYHWSKHYEWEKFIDLPCHTDQPLELALKIDTDADRKRLESYGWRVVSPLPMSLDVFGDYPAYIHRSRGEFTVAKDQNVRLRSGWFSERSACYLASGKPVITQETGFSNILPTGEGLFSFSTMAEALAAIETINANYRKHCESARAIAAEYFDAGRVAARFLKDCGLG